MAESIDELVQELYDKFRGLPNTNSIVRNSQPNDAYTVAILKLLYSLLCPCTLFLHSSQSLNSRFTFLLSIFLIA